MRLGRRATHDLFLQRGPRVGAVTTLLPALLALAPGCGAGTAASPSRAASAASATSRDGALPAEQTGIASWYSDRLAGRHTASGTPYDPALRTAAHRTLPLGTTILVTRVDSGCQVEVVVNDRGPFGDARRILDLSRAAATELDMLSAGVVPVHVRVLRLGPARRR
jgi:rare lipoprotein A